MRKYTLREIKDFIRLGLAQDITNADPDTVAELWKHSEKVGYSSGVYGINGGTHSRHANGRVFRHYCPK